MSQLQEEQQTIAQQSSRHELLHQPHPHTGMAATAARSTGGHVHARSSSSQHQQRVQSAIKTNTSIVNSNQWIRNGHINKTRADLGAVLAESTVEQSRASSAKLKGRLGHLVAAIAESHSSSSTTSMDRCSDGPGTHNTKSGGPSRVHVHVHSNAWMPDDSSLDCIEMHTCSKCDKMYGNREALEHHQSICTL